MLTDMQEACRDYLTEKLIADVGLAAFKEITQLENAAALPEGFTLYEVRSVTEAESEEEGGGMKVLPEERHVIFVKVREAPSDITVLTDCMIEISVGSPVDVPGVKVATHAALERAVKRAFDKRLHPTAETDLSDHIEIYLPGFTGGGFKAEGWQEAREDTQLLPVYTVKAGVKEDWI